MATFRSCALWSIAILMILGGSVLAADEAPGDLFGRLKAKVKDGEPFQLLVEVPLKPGTEAKFAAELTKAVKATAAEPGCDAYAAFNDLEKPGTVILFESWKSMAALKSHIGQPYIVSLLKVMEEIGTAPKITLLGPLAGPKSAP